MKLHFKTDGQTDRDTSALVELRFAAKNGGRFRYLLEEYSPLESPRIDGGLQDIVIEGTNDKCVVYQL